MNEPTQIQPRRLEKCRECDRLWNISRQAVISESGYLCPHCWSRQQSNLYRIGARNEKPTKKHQADMQAREMG